MGLFSKKYCDICGEKIGLLGNRKLEDGNCCKDCARKLSNWFTDRKQSTIDDINRQLAYREENKKRVKEFVVSKSFDCDTYHLYLDYQHGWFAVGRSLNEDVNPDIIELSKITSSRIDIDEDRIEQHYKDREGNLQSYTPPRYDYEYQYYLEIHVNCEWFDEIRFAIHPYEIEANQRTQLMNIEHLGNEMLASLINQPMMNQQGSGSMNQQPMNQQGYGTINQQPMNQQGFGSMNQQPLNQQGFGTMNQQPMNQQPTNQQTAMNQQYGFNCMYCGFKQDASKGIPKFCPCCGSKTS